MPSDITPFRIAVEEAELTDLRERLARTRWPERETVGDWSQGIPLDYLQELCEHWRERYDWRRTEAALNEIEQFTTELDGLPIHFLHARSPHDGALPLLMTHGWPGSIVEFSKVIGPLTDPPAHGGEAGRRLPRRLPVAAGVRVQRQAARPGLGRRADRRGMGAADGAPRVLALRRAGRRLGRDVTTALAGADADASGRHPPQHGGGGPDGARRPRRAQQQEQAALAAFAHYRRWDSGYSTQQSTRPQTVGYGLVDSPAALCGWIVEKFWAWTDCDGHPENVLTRDELLDNVMLYWLPAAGASSARLYWESFRARDFKPIDVPAGISVFPKEIFRVSRRWAQTRFSDLRHFGEPPRGGHFAAMEQPQLFVDELRAFFATVR